ncbi:barstar family protein [Streptomyces sp. NPDC006923]|uniref:barstar family protein n=1 Tax=Streptomyces sp. NPDC006923 TaxID=3155355 RepID=UPI0033EC9D62
MRVTIDGSQIRSESDIHDALSRKLDFGPYYGRNLDALWDRLSADVERPVELIWEHSEASKAALGIEVFERFSSVLIRVMDQDESFGLDERFTVRFE